MRFVGLNDFFLDEASVYFVAQNEPGDEYESNDYGIHFVSLIITILKIYWIILEYASHYENGDCPFEPFHLKRE